MDASAIMTRSVVTAGPDMPLPDVARLMVEQRISAVPVVDRGALAGILSEGDLLRRTEIGTERRRRRWVELVLSNASLAADYVKQHGRKVADVMTRNVITVSPATDVADIAHILETNHIKRVPVMEAGKLVGIVSRANVVQALASSGPGGLPQGSRADAEIQQSINKELGKHRWGLRANAVVKDGVVHLWGLVGSEQERRAILVATENTAGVRSVEDHLEEEPVVLMD